jgi:hypothetical protein
MDGTRERAEVQLGEGLLFSWLFSRRRTREFITPLITCFFKRIKDLR